MTVFHDVRFPLSIGLGARGGPQRRTEIVALASGREERNSPWFASRRRWDAAPGVRSLDDVARLTAFFEARRGQLHAFRFVDPLDHKSCLPSKAVSATDQILGTGDGTATQFVLTKSYDPGELAWVRTIQKPVAESILVAVNGVSAPHTLNGDGSILLDTPPALGEVVTAGFHFDLPVRFDTDQLDIGTDGSATGLVGSVPLIEVLL